MGALDAFLPIVGRLAAEPWKGSVDLVIMNRAVDAIVLSSRLHSEIFARHANIVRLEVGSGSPKGILSSVRKAARLTWLLLRRRLTHRRLIVLTALVGDGRRERLLLRLFDLVGTHFFFPSNQMPATAEFSRRLASDAWTVLMSQGAKKRVAPKIAVRRAIRYTPSEVALARPGFAARTQFFPIGVPRLYPGWPEFISRTAEASLETELRQRGLDPKCREIAVLVVPAPEYFWFDDPRGCYRLIDDVIGRIRGHLPKLPILIKAKPQHAERFRGALPAGDSNIVTTIGLAALATRARFAVGIQETSGIFDFLALEVPVIEYGRYSQAWLRVCPSGSAYRDFPGVTHVETVDALDSAVAAAKAGTLPRPSRLALGQLLQDQDRFDQLLGEAAISA